MDEKWSEIWDLLQHYLLNRNEESGEEQKIIVENSDKLSAVGVSRGTINVSIMH